MKLLDLINKNNIAIFVVLLVASTLRLIHLGEVPFGFANDEVSYIISGYTIAQTGGYDIANAFLPLSVNLDSSLSPVPVYLIAFFVKIFGLTPFAARLPFALLGIGSVFIVYLISYELFRRKSSALFSSMIMALSSWHILITRGAWDVIPAQFFYLIGFFIFIKGVGRGRAAWSIPFYLLGFFSYHGTKVFFIFFLLFTIILFFRNLIRYKKDFAIFITGILGIFVLFGFVTITQSVTRQSEIIFTNESILKDAEKNINYDRDKSSAPFVLRQIESNKLTFIADKIASNYLNAFSANFLFFVGDIQPIFGYGIFFKGVLYLIDLPLLAIGMIFLISKSGFFATNTDKNFKNYRKALILVLGGLLLSPLPSTLGAGSSYVIRSFMMVPFLSMIAGIGVFTIWGFVQRRKLRLLLIVIIAVLYGLFAVRFLYQYYYQFNTFGGEFWNRSSREISEYIMSNYSNYDEFVVVTSEDKVFFQFSFLSQADPSEIQKAWKKEWPIVIGKVRFIDSCYEDIDVYQKDLRKVLYFTPDNCHQNLKAEKRFTDSLEPLRTIWKVYEI